MDTENGSGPLEEQKRSKASQPGRPEPVAAEVESARLLANEARDELHSAGLDDLAIDRLADRFVAEDRGEDLRLFITWATKQAGAA